MNEQLNYISLSMYIMVYQQANIVSQCLQSAGGQVGVDVLKVSVERDPTTVEVGAQHGLQVHRLG